MRPVVLQDPLECCVVSGPTRWPGSLKLELCHDDKQFERLRLIPGVTPREDGKDPSQTGWYVPQSIFDMGKMPANLEDYPPELNDVTPSGLKLRRYEARAVTYLRQVDAQREGAILAADPGLGKQQPVDTKVLTPDGWREIGSLTVGDMVIGSNGLPVQVLGVFPQGVKPSYRVRFSDGSAVEAGPEHLWTVAYRSSRRRPYTWRELELSTQQLLSRPKLTYVGSNGQDYTLDLQKTSLYLPMLSQPVQFSYCALPIPAYLLGQLIANGGLGHGTPCLVSGAVDWPEVLMHLAYAGCAPSSVRTYGSAVHATFSGVLGRIRELGLAVGSVHKRIPRIYMQSSVEDRMALLRGLMDGDGSISAERCRVTYHSISHNLSNDVAELVEGLGGIASVREYDRAHEDKPTEYQVRIRMPAGIAPFSIRRKLDRYKPGKNALPVRTLVGVEYARDVESVCIAVDAADKLYCTEHCILTHNTVTSLHALHLDGYLSRRGLVIGPNIAKGVWCDDDSDAMKHYNLRVMPLEGVKNIDPLVLQTHWCFFCHYELLEAWQPWIFEILKPTWMIIDESHYLTNQKAQRSKAARQVALCASIERRYALTGTPIPNERIELWQQLAVVQPRQWSTSKHDFGVRYCDGHRNAPEEGGHWEYIGESNDVELKARLAGTFLRFTTDEVMSELPPMERHAIDAECLDENLLDEYSLAQRDIVKYLEYKNALPKETQTITLGNVTVKLTKTDYAPGATRLVCLSTLIGILSRMKQASALAAINKIMAEHDRLVVFTWRIQTAEWIHSKLLDTLAAGNRIGGKSPLIYGPVHGEMDMSERKALAREFAAQNQSIYVATMGSAGTSINTLSAASAALIVDLHWNSHRLHQAEKRVHRDGCAAKKVDIYYLVARQTVDDLFLAALREKAARAVSIAPRDTQGLSLVRDLSPDNVSGKGADLDLLCARLMDMT